MPEGAQATGALPFQRQGSSAVYINCNGHRTAKYHYVGIIIDFSVGQECSFDLDLFGLQLNFILIRRFMFGFITDHKNFDFA